ncbi:MAG: hypothetical protein BIFFINMI_02401 [Phycisphaerae bacterium]|nr:hypothetical protein [Phycisphaerae bacterium]
MRRAAVFVALLPGFLAVSAPVSGQEDSSQTVVIYFVLTNSSDRPATDVRFWAVLPATNAYQDIESMTIWPEPAVSVPDRLGQKRVGWSLDRIEPGSSVTLMALIHATTHAVRIGRDSKPKDKPSAEEQLDYLRDDPDWFDLKEVAGATRGWIARPADDDTGRARQIFESIRKQCRYVLDNKRDTAVDVIRTRQGSCTELAFVFIGMARANGISARMCTGWVNRSGGSLDTVNHRWAEYWDARYGWVPVDLSRAINHAASRPATYDPNLYFGRVAGQFLVVRDDGVQRPNDNNWSGYRASFRGALLNVGRASAWQATGSADAERKLFAQATACMDQILAGKPPPSLGDWAAKDSPLARNLLPGFLGCGSDALRREAARRLAEGPDPSASAALLATAGQTADAVYRQYLVGLIDGMLANPTAKFRGAVVAEIGRARLELLRPQAERMLKDVSPLVRQSAQRTIDRLDKAKATTQPDGGQDD